MSAPGARGWASGRPGSTAVSDEVNDDNVLSQQAKGKETKEPMAKKLFVGGLAWATTDESLREAFEEFGEVRDAKVIMDRETGKSRGFGFITMDDDAEADEAMERMNNASLDGRTIKVDEARERAPRREGGGGGGGYGGGGGGGGYGRGGNGGGGGGDRRGGGGGGGRSGRW